MKNSLRQLLSFGIVLTIISDGVAAETKSISVSKDAPSGSATFSGTKTSERNYIRNLVVGTADQGEILWAQILANAENDAWKQNSAGLPHYQVRFTGTQNAGAADKPTKTYTPKFQGRAVVKGSGSEAREEYTWNASAKYDISDHDMIVDKKEENHETNGSKITVSHNGATDQGKWKNYTKTDHGFNVTGDPDTIPIVDVPDFIKIPDLAGGEHAKYDGNIDSNTTPGKATRYTNCDICKKTNKYRYAFRFTGSIDGKSQITMPKWNDIGKADIVGPNTAIRWNKWWNNLYTHEKGHWDITVDHLKKLYQLAEKHSGKLHVVEVCCGVDTAKAKEEAEKAGKVMRDEIVKKFDEEYEKIIADWKAAHIQYDTDTGHGATQGVSFGQDFMKVITD